MTVDAGTTWAEIKAKVQEPTKEGSTFKGWAAKAAAKASKNRL